MTLIQIGLKIFFPLFFSFFKNSKCRIVTVRAGNCFGGGDWTKERIAKDALECFYNNRTLTLRMPEATRPWQHVIEPLFGYILLVQKLCSKDGKKYVGAWNFGPSLQQNLQVIKFAKMFRKKIQAIKISVLSKYIHIIFFILVSLNFVL